MLFGHLPNGISALRRQSRLLALCLPISLSCIGAKAWAEQQPQSIEPGAVPSQHQPLARHSNLVDIIRRDQGVMAVGERGHILASDVSGWQQHSSPVDAMLTRVFFIDQQHGWSVGHDSSIIATVDGGASWQLQHHQPSTDRPLFDLYFKDSQQGLAIGAYGGFLRTQDGGKTWHKEFLASLLPVEDQEYMAELKQSSMEDYLYEQSSILPHFNRLIPLSNDRLLLVGELGLMAISDDFGHSWQRLPEIYPGSFFAALETRSGALLVGGLRGNLFKSSDEGRHWSAVTLPEQATINGIYQDHQDHIYLATNKGSLLLSTDNGVSFTVIHRFKGQKLVNVTRVDDTLWIAGSHGLHQVPAQPTRQQP